MITLDYLVLLQLQETFQEQGYIKGANGMDVEPGNLYTNRILSVNSNGQNGIYLMKCLLYWALVKTGDNKISRKKNNSNHFY
jgi:hypothetical protein